MSWFIFFTGSTNSNIICGYVACPHDRGWELWEHALRSNYIIKLSHHYLSLTTTNCLPSMLAMADCTGQYYLVAYPHPLSRSLWTLPCSTVVSFPHWYPQRGLSPQNRRVGQKVYKLQDQRVQLVWSAAHRKQLRTLDWGFNGRTS